MPSPRTASGSPAWAGVSRRWDHPGDIDLLVGDLKEDRPALRGKERLTETPTSLHLTADGRTVVLVYTDRHRLAVCTVATYDVSGAAPTPRTTFKTDKLRCVALHPDGTQFVAGTEDGRLRLHNLDTGKAETGHFTLGGPTALDVSPDGRFLLAASADGQLVLWEIASGVEQKRWQFPWRIDRVRYFPDGRHVLTYNGDGTVFVLRLPR